MRQASASALVRRRARLALDGLEQRHAREHRHDEQQRLRLAHAERDQRRARTEAGEAPADAEQHAARNQAAIDGPRRRQAQRVAEQRSAAARASAKAGAPTAIAPPMTNTSDGSQRPAMSRKPSTLAGSAMPETIKPMPKTRPAAKASSACMRLPSSQQVARDEYRGEARAHERGGRGDRAQRQARQAAHAVAAGAARAVARTDAHQQAGADQQRCARLDAAPAAQRTARSGAARRAARRRRRGATPCRPPGAATRPRCR